MRFLGGNHGKIVQLSGVSPVNDFLGWLIMARCINYTDYCITLLNEKKMFGIYSPTSEWPKLPVISFLFFFLLQTSLSIPSPLHFYLSVENQRPFKPEFKTVSFMDPLVSCFYRFFFSLTHNADFEMVIVFFFFEIFSSSKF